MPEHPSLIAFLAVSYALPLALRRMNPKMPVITNSARAMNASQISPFTVNPTTERISHSTSNPMMSPMSSTLDRGSCLVQGLAHRDRLAY